MNSEEKKCMYANKFSITISPNDAVMSFKWIAPEYADDGSVCSEKAVDDTMVIVSRESLWQLRSMINDLYEKAMGNNGNK